MSSFGIAGSQVSMPLGSIFSDWVDATSSAGASTQDASGTITNPDTELADTKALPITRGNQAGYRLQLRYAYTAGATGVTGPTVMLWGRKSPTGKWEKRPAVDGGATATLGVASGDYTDATLKYSAVNELSQMFRLNGCDQFKVGIVTAAAGTGLTVSKVQLKFVD
jgi:hypothetical protein